MFKAKAAVAALGVTVGQELENEIYKRALSALV